MPSTVLLVIEDSALRDELANALSAAWYRLVVASDAPTAIQLLQNMPVAPSAMILDWNLSRAGGRDILAHHAADPRCANAPVVVLAKPNLVARIPRLCVAEILLSPVKPATLLDVLGRALAAAARPYRHETNPTAA